MYFTHFVYDRGGFQDANGTRYEVVEQSKREASGYGWASFKVDGVTYLQTKPWLEYDSIDDYLTAVGLTYVSGGTGGTVTAISVTYSNVTSGLTATNVQDAIDENDARLDALEALDLDPSVITDNADGTYVHDDGQGTTVDIVTDKVFDFAPTTAYLANEVVVESGQLYRRIADGTSGATFDAAEQANWLPLQSVAVSHKVDLWAAATDYEAGEVVIQNGELYRRIADGTSGATFDAAEEANWTLLATIAFQGATTAADGAIGDVPAPLTDQQNKVLRGDGAWGDLIPSWAATTAYEPNDVVYDPATSEIFRRTAAGTSGATFDAAEKALWTQMSWKDDTPTVQHISAAHTAASGELIFADNTGGVFTVTLPATPEDGDKVTVVDSAGGFATANQVTVSGNGNNINGAAGTKGLRAPYSINEFVYDATAGTWVLGVENEKAAIPVEASTTAAAGEEGLVPQPPQDSQNQFLRGDATFGSSVPSWVTATNYEVGDVVRDPATGEVWFANVAHTAGATFDNSNTEKDQWTRLSQTFNAIEYVVADPAPAVPNTAYWADTTAIGAFTITLPNLGLKDGDFVVIHDQATFDVNNLTVGRAGNTIDTFAADLVLDQRGQTVWLVWDSALSTWINILPNGLANIEVFTGAATTGDVGVKGLVPKPADNEQNQFLRGDATFGTSIPAWAAGVDYEVDDVVYDAATGEIFKANTAHTSAGTFTGLVKDSWDRLSPAINSLEVSAAAATMEANRAYLVDTSGSAFTLTMPSLGLKDGDFILIHDQAGSFGTNNLTVGNGGANIEGAGTDYVLDQDNQSALLVFDTATGWHDFLAGASASVMTGATTSAAGTAGTVPAPAQDEQNQYFTGGGTYEPSIPAHVAAKDYEVGDIVRDSATGEIFVANTAHTSIALTGTERDNWDRLSSHYGSVELVNAAANAEVGKAYLADTSGGAFTLTLPSLGLKDGDVIYVHDQLNSFSTNNLTIARNGNTIDGAAADLVLSVDGDSAYLVFDSANGWFNLIPSPLAATTMTGATTAAAGTGGSAPQPPVDTQNKPLFGDATYKEIIPAWTGPGTQYETGDIFREPNTNEIYRASVPFVSSAAFAADLGNVLQLSWQGPSFNTVSVAGGDSVDGEPSIIFVDTSGGAFQRDLPNGLTNNAWLIYVDTESSFATNNLTIDGNGNTINGAAGPYVASNDNGVITCFWDAVASDWVVSEGGGAVAMSGATTSAAGTGGTVPAPAQDQQHKVLTGGASWQSNIPEWQAATDYEVGDVVLVPGALGQMVNAFRCTTAHTSTASPIPIAELEANWRNIAGGNFQSHTFAVNGATGSISKENVQNRDYFISGDTTGGATDLTLPALDGWGYLSGSAVYVVDAAAAGSFATQTFTVSPNGGDLINGANASVNLTTDGGAYVFIPAFDSSASPIGWIFKEIGGGSSTGAQPEIPDFAAATAYTVGDVVKDNGVVYQRTSTGTSGGTLAADIANWASLTGARSFSFDGTTSWGAAAAGEYTLTVDVSAILNVTHVATVEVRNAAGEVVDVDTAVVGTNVTLQVPETPDQRFAGTAIVVTGSTSAAVGV